jgi:hypothetical protein
MRRRRRAPTLRPAALARRRRQGPCTPGGHLSRPCPLWATASTQVGTTWTTTVTGRATCSTCASDRREAGWGGGRKACCASVHVSLSRLPTHTRPPACRSPASVFDKVPFLLSCGVSPRSTFIWEARLPPPLSLPFVNIFICTLRVPSPLRPLVLCMPAAGSACETSRPSMPTLSRQDAPLERRSKSLSRRSARQSGVAAEEGLAPRINSTRRDARAEADPPHTLDAVRPACPRTRKDHGGETVPPTSCLEL